MTRAVSAAEEISLVIINEVKALSRSHDEWRERADLFEAENDRLRARVAELEQELSNEKSRYYAIINTCNGSAIRGWEGEPLCQEIIEAERNRIDHYRKRVAELEKVLEAGTETVRLAVVRVDKAEGRVAELEAALRRIRDQEPHERPWINARLIANEALGGTGMPSSKESK